MAVPFDGSDSAEPVIGWLHCPIDSSGPTAALLLTDAAGKPLGFTLAATKAESNLGEDAECRNRRRQLACIKTVFRTSSPTPSLLITVSDEVAAVSLQDDIRVQVPFVCIGSADAGRWSQRTSSARRGQKTAARQLGHDAEATCDGLLEPVLRQSDPFEPMKRVQAALREVWQDHPSRSALTDLSISISSFPIPDSPPAAGEHGWIERKGSKRRQQAPDHALAGRLRAALAIPEPCHPVSTSDLAWPSELLPFQMEGARALVTSEHLLLADDMGLGKTLQAIAAVRILLASRAIQDCLIVAPASLLRQWLRELAKWAPEVRAVLVSGSAADRSLQWESAAEVNLVSYDSLRADFKSGRIATPWRRTWGVVIADEAQRIKNRNATSGAVKELLRQRSWALTGTPIENREDELASIMEFVDHDASGARRRYGPGEELRSRHRQVQVRRRKPEVLDQLPRKLISVVAIELSGEQAVSYEKARQEGIVYLESLGREIHVTDILGQITRLKQICNADPRTGKSGKLDDLQRRLAQLTMQGHKALIFSQYAGHQFGVEAIARRLNSLDPLLITGSTPVHERESVIDLFKKTNDHRVLIMSLRVGGLGLNLQEASYVFHYDRWWNPAAEFQSEDRAHRFGQKNKVHVIKYSCIGTIEERIDEILSSKRGLFEDLVDDVSLDLSTRMSTEDMLGLFGLSGARPVVAGR